MTKFVFLDICINKYFLSVYESAEKKIADEYFKNGRLSLKVTKTQFYCLRTGKKDWLSNGFAKIPENLSHDPVYWIVPWENSYREPVTLYDRFFKIINFRKILKDFYSLSDNILKNGFDNSKNKITGYLFYNSDGTKKFLYTNGNRRLGILASLSDIGKINKSKIKIYIDLKGEFQRDKLFQNKVICKNMKKFNFTEEDVYAWFDNIFI
jgi:hypothetical protein